MAGAAIPRAFEDFPSFRSTMLVLARRGRGKCREADVDVGLIENTPMSPVSVVVLSMLSSGPGEAKRLVFSLRVRGSRQTACEGDPKTQFKAPWLAERRAVCPGSIDAARPLDEEALRVEDRNTKVEKGMCSSNYD